MIVSKWGNSLAVRLPKALVDRLNLKEGDQISLQPLDVSIFEVSKDDVRHKAIERMASRRWKLPSGWHFDREEANAR